MLYKQKRYIFRHKIENIKAILNKTENCIIYVIFYGNVIFPFTGNTSILDASVEYNGGSHCTASGQTSFQVTVNLYLNFCCFYIDFVPSAPIFTAKMAFKDLS